MDVRVITTEQDWNELAEGFGAHPMQMWQWGSLKEQTGPWCAHRLEMLDSDGTSVGGAQVSTKHAGFVVNVGGATASDVMQVIDDVRSRVFEQSGVMLEPEVRLWGFEQGN